MTIDEHASWRLRSTRIITPGGELDGVVTVVDGRIAAVRSIDADAEHEAVGELLDVGELPVLPGLVDTHVHVNDPGRADWEGWATASAAALAGGVTTIVDMPLNSIPATTSAAAVTAKLAAAAGTSHVDFALWGGLVPGNAHHADELRALVAAGVVGFKCFLVDSGVPEFAAVEENDLVAAMPVLADLGVPLLVHAELPEWLEACAPGTRSHREWVASRPPASEIEAARFVADLALRSGCHTHVVHISHPDTLLAIDEVTGGARTPDGQSLVSCETCPHYLVFDGDEVPDGATAYKCAPPLRDAACRAGLWDGVVGGAIELVASDHSPSPAALKHIDDGDFAAAWGGIASLQLGLSALFTHAPVGVNLVDLARLMAAAPARLAGLELRKGAIEVGRDADLVVFDPHASWTVHGEQLLHRHPLTPYEGMELRGQVQMTFLRGRRHYDRGTVSGDANGRHLTRKR